MINYITEIIRHILTLYFGVFVTTAIIGIKNNKKNFLIVNCFCILDLLLHMICSMLKSSSHVLNAYPLLTHLPLLLLLIFIFKRSLLKSLQPGARPTSILLEFTVSWALRWITPFLSLVVYPEASAPTLLRVNLPM